MNFGDATFGPKVYIVYYSGIVSNCCLIENAFNFSGNRSPSNTTSQNRTIYLLPMDYPHVTYAC